MSNALLNENQRRRVATHLHLLEEDLAALARVPALQQSSASFDRIRALLAEIAQKGEALRNVLGLGVPPAPSLKRRIGAVAEIWAMRMEDLMAHRLRGYGRVHPGLSALLDHQVAELIQLLQRLADVSAELPEG
jgi:hypothetical protein